MIAPAYAVKFPQHTISVGLLSTVAGRSEEDSKKVWNVIHAMEKNGIEKTLSTLTNRWFTDEFIKNKPDLVERRLKQVVDTDPEVFLNVFADSHFVLIITARLLLLIPLIFSDPTNLSR